MNGEQTHKWSRRRIAFQKLLVPRQIVMCLVVAKFWKLKKISMEAEAKEEAQRATALRVLSSLNMLHKFATFSGVSVRKLPSSDWTGASLCAPVLGSASGNTAGREDAITATPLPDSSRQSMVRWRTTSARPSPPTPEQATAALVSNLPPPQRSARASFGIGSFAAARGSTENVPEPHKVSKKLPRPFNPTTSSVAPDPDSEALGEACESELLPVSTGLLRRTARSSHSSHFESHQLGRISSTPSAQLRSGTGNRSPSHITQATAFGFLQGVLQSGAGWVWPQQWTRTAPRRRSRSAHGGGGVCADSGDRSAVSDVGMGIFRRLTKDSEESSGGEDSGRQSSCSNVVSAMDRLERRLTSPRISTDSRGVP